MCVCALLSDFRDFCEIFFSIFVKIVEKRLKIYVTFTLENDLCKYELILWQTECSEKN